MRIYGKNVFNEIKDNKEIKKAYLSKNFKDIEIISYIKNNNIKYELVDPSRLDNLVNGNHQGIVLEVKEYEYQSIDDMFNDKLVVMLDHLEDPHNLGAIIRTCEAAGVKSIIIPNDRSVSVNGTVMKISCGALTNVNVASVTNLVNTINEFKENGFFVYAADMDGTNYKKVNFSDKVLLIIGNEGKGISKLVGKNSDEIISIPMQGKINSLNASVAAGILIYGIVNEEL